MNYLKRHTHHQKWKCLRQCQHRYLPQKTTQQPRLTPTSSPIPSSGEDPPPSDGSAPIPPINVTPPPNSSITLPPTPIDSGMPGNPSLQLRPGDKDVRFDANKFDNNFPQIKQWITAGVRGGIPPIDSYTVQISLDGGNSDSINNAIDKAAQRGGGVVLLQNGVYQIDKQVTMRSHVVLSGESRDRTVAIISMVDGNAFFFGKGIKNSGIHNIRIEGVWGQPQYKWLNQDSAKNYELPGNNNVSVMFKEAEDSWIDGVDIINSAGAPLICNAKYITMRNLNVDGVHNKHNADHGSFFILGAYNLLTQSKITHLRHIAIQGDGVEYNVIYDNDLRQEISFYQNDDGNNLVENNRITLPVDMPNTTPDYRAIMGPSVRGFMRSKKNNFLYGNEILEENHNDTRRMSGHNNVHIGPIFHYSEGEQQTRNFPADKYIPKARTLYPILLNH